MVTLLKKIVCEWDNQIIEDLKLNGDDRIFLNEIKSKVEILELKSGLKIITNSWIGVIKLSNFTLEIRPKFDKDFKYLPFMINYTNNNYNILKSKEKFKISSNDNLIELIVRMFIFELQNVLLKGLMRDYNLRSEDILTIKGKVNFTKQIQQNLNLPLPISCIYDEYDYNIIENQIILLTLEFLSSLKINYELKKDIQVYLHFFHQICSIQDVRRDLWIFSQFKYHRQNQYYKELHNLCQFILLRHGIEDIYVRGNQSIFCFLLDMNYLFEEFVYRLLCDFSNKNININKQKSRNDVIIYKGENYQSIRPDIRVYDSNNEILEIIDVKYKQYGEINGDKISSADIYQLYFYSCAYFSSENTNPHSKIIYFMNEGDREEIELTLNADSQHPSKLKALGIDIITTIKKIIEEDGSYIHKLVSHIILA